jgi:hypothetical protein
MLLEERAQVGLELGQAGGRRERGVGAEHPDRHCPRATGSLVDEPVAAA